MKLTISKLNIISVARILGILYVILGFIYGILFTLMSLVEPTFAMFGWISIILFPILFGIMGFVMGIILSWLYNVVASWVGGISFESEK